MQQPQAELEGTLEYIIYQNEANGWSVVRLAVDGQPVTATGPLFGVHAGERLRLQGGWVTNRDYGEQFEVHSYLALMPDTLTGIERYLASGFIPGIGKETAARIVEAFGLEVIDVLDREPERLTKVSGIGKKRARAMAEGWKRHRQIKDVMIFLQSHGVSAAFAARIYKVYGNEAVARIKADPYRLSEDVFGIGFKSADSIARSLGMEDHAPQRLRAGLLHVLAMYSDRGHVCVRRPELLKSAAEQLDDCPPDLLQDALGTLTTEARVVSEMHDGEFLIYHAALHGAETGVARLLSSLHTPPPLNLAPASSLERFERLHDLTLAAEQVHAVELSVEHQVLIITGGPGTGKTTIIRAILDLFEDADLTMALCAPTGRAAKRMTETTGREAKTIHRLLEFSPHNQCFERNEEKPLDCDALIVDEMSMVDIVLCYRLLLALPTRARLVLVGDADQLPSVGPGTVLKDLIASKAVPCIQLKHIFRQAEQSSIVRNAHRINEGLAPELQPDPGSDFFFIRREDPDEAVATITELVQHNIPESFGLDAKRDIQVLAPMHRGTLGVSRLNEALQAALNPGAPGLRLGAMKLTVGDRVMQMVNNYDLGVFNGDLGFVEEIQGETRLCVSFDGRPVWYESADLAQLSLAYACSIHKSQGNEYPAVVLALHTQHYVMLRRTLLYTAITRGKRLVVIVGSPRAIPLAVNRTESSTRLGLLDQRLTQLTAGTD